MPAPSSPHCGAVGVRRDLPCQAIQGRCTIIKEPSPSYSCSQNRERLSKKWTVLLLPGLSEGTLIPANRSDPADFGPHILSTNTPTLNGDDGVGYKTIFISGEDCRRHWRHQRHWAGHDDCNGGSWGRHYPCTSTELLRRHGEVADLLIAE